VPPPPGGGKDARADWVLLICGYDIEAAYSMTSKDLP